MTSFFDKRKSIHGTLVLLHPLIKFRMRLSFILLILLSSTLTFGQTERNALKASVGISGHIAENVQTPSLVLAFNKDFYPKTQLELHAAWLFPVEIQTVEEQIDLQHFRFGMHFVYKVLEEQKQSFKIGAGFSAGLYLVDQTVLASQEMTNSADFLPGFSLLIEYHYILPSQWMLGLRASTARYDADRGSWFLGASLGYQF